MDEEENPPAPLPETGKQGSAGEEGTEEGVGGAGGHGGRGGRGGIGLTGAPGRRGDSGRKGDVGRTGETGQRGQRGPAGKVTEQPILRVIGETGPPGKEGPPGDKQTKFDKWALAVVVVVTAMSAIYFSGQAQHRLNDIDHATEDLHAAQRSFKDTVDCTQKVVTTTVLAIKARSAFAEQSSKEALRLDVAQAAYLDAIIQPGQTVKQQLATLAVYRKALGFNITAVRDQLRVRDLNPFPTVADVRHCEAEKDIP